MTDLPKFVEFREDGPREGFQIEPTIYPLERRAALIDKLSETGVKQIQVASFVNPRAVPTMADAADLFQAIKRRDGVRYTALWLNEKGFEKALATPGVDIHTMIMFYTTDTFSIRNNNCSVVEMRDRQLEWLDIYKSNGFGVESAYFMTAFGCNFEGAVALEAVTDLVRWTEDVCADRNLELPAMFLADTMGWANPEDIKRRIGAVRDIVPEARIGLHLHDTRGLGAANFYAALEMGVDLFESSLGGLGGCPFAGHKSTLTAGNVCTEDMIFMCHELGIETGISLDIYIEAAQMAESIVGRSLSGRVMHSGSLEQYRS